MFLVQQIREHHKNFPFNVVFKIFLDALAFLTAFLLSYLIRFSIDTAGAEIEQIITFIPLYIVIRLASFALFRLYSFIWRYSGIYALFNIIKASALGTVLLILVRFFLSQPALPRSIVVVDLLLVIFFSGGVRLLVRQIFSVHTRSVKTSGSRRRILIYGAGSAGELLLRNIENSDDLDIEVIGFLDDDRLKQGKYIHNKRVLGDRNSIGRLVDKYRINEIYFSIPRLSGSETRNLLKTIRDQAGDGIVIKTIPGLADLVNGRVSVNQLRNFEIKDLLRRKPVSLDFDQVKLLIEGNSVAVVGGGGSIGSELCYQIASFNPEKIVIIDNSEFNCFSVEATINKQYPDLNLVCLVADACDEVYFRKIFNHYKPDIVFHAAAYKHVPMMEMNPWAAVKNNLKSTLVLTRLCDEFRVDKFVLISTDKAVQPTSVMGATKRICELITLLHSGNGGTKYITVRFGNVLGSSGSVIHKFKEQIKQGGPVTVTHPKITRYFMLISEAVELVLQAGAIGTNGKIYVLDMGEPIKIFDLAKYIIELSGLKLNEDIRIVYNGLRPGEKLHESLLLVGQEKKTEVPNLFVLEPKLNIGSEYLNQVEALLVKSYQLNHKKLRSALKVLVPEYQPTNIEIGTFPEKKGTELKYFVHPDSKMTID